MTRKIIEENIKRTFHRKIFAFLSLSFHIEREREIVIYELYMIVIHHLWIYILDEAKRS